MFLFEHPLHWIGFYFILKFYDKVNVQLILILCLLLLPSLHKLGGQPAFYLNFLNLSLTQQFLVALKFWGQEMKRLENVFKLGFVFAVVLMKYNFCGLLVLPWPSKLKIRYLED